MVRLRDAHFYRKVPKDVSEATKLGGIVSVVGVITILWLVLEAHAEYASVRHINKMGLDHTAMPSPLGAHIYVPLPFSQHIGVDWNCAEARLPLLTRPRTPKAAQDQRRATAACA